MIIDRTLAGDEAHFSDCRRFRYLLVRRLGQLTNDTPPKIITFLMLNPSTADAFADDRTVAKCMKFAAKWGGDVLEVVNLFALITPYPTDLKLATDRGDDATNDEYIQDAARRSSKMIAAWGVDGNLTGRDARATALLFRTGVPLYHLGRTQDGFPLHPLARGKHHVPLDRKPEVWPWP